MYIWLSPDGNTKNEIDYILTNRKDIIQDVTILNKFNTGSDHRLVRAMVVIDKKNERRNSTKTKTPTKIKAEELKQHNSLYKEIINKALANDDLSCESVDEINERLVQIIQESVKQLNTIIPRKTDKEQLIDEETRNLMEKRRNLATKNKRATLEYTETNRNIRRNIREQRIKAHEKQVNEVIQNNKCMKGLQRNTGKKEIYSLRNKDGKIIHDRDEILHIVEDFYTDLYESKTPPEKEDAETLKRKIQNIGSEDIPEINIEEVKATLEGMKNNKATGDDNISAEMI